MLSQKGAKHLWQQNGVRLPVAFWQITEHYLGKTLRNKWKVQEFNAITASIKET